MANVAEAGSGKNQQRLRLSLTWMRNSARTFSPRPLLAEATAAVAKKLRDEAAAKRTAAAERAAEAERALVREAMVEFLRLQFGKKQAPKIPELMEKLKKACKCHLSFGGGFHKAKCFLHPINLKGTLTRHLQNRENIEQQLMKRISLSAPQRESALQHLFGPSSKASGSGTRGG